MQNTNNQFVAAVNKAADMVILSVLWVVCSLPIVTIGAASAALYHAVAKSIRSDFASAAGSFWQAFKGNLRACVPFTLVCLVLGAAFGVTLYAGAQKPGNFLANVYLVLCTACLLLLLLVQVHAYALIGRFDLSGRELFTLLVKLMGTNMGHNLLMLFSLLLMVVLSLFLPPVLFITPALFMVLLSLREEKRFARFINFTSEDDILAGERDCL